MDHAYSCSGGMQKTSRVTANTAGPTICACTTRKALQSNHAMKFNLNLDSDWTRSNPVARTTRTYQGRRQGGFLLPGNPHGSKINIIHTDER